MHKQFLPPVNMQVILGNMVTEKATYIKIIRKLNFFHWKKIKIKGRKLSWARVISEYYIPTGFSLLSNIYLVYRRQWCLSCILMILKNLLTEELNILVITMRSIQWWRKQCLHSTTMGTQDDQIEYYFWLN